MNLGDHIAHLKEKKCFYAKRLKLPVPCITRYLRGERGLSAKSIKIILDDAQGALSFQDLVPNPYQGNGKREAEATKKITLKNCGVIFFLGRFLAKVPLFYQRKSGHKHKI